MKWVLAAILICGNMLLTSCSKEDEPETQENTYTGVPIVIFDTDIPRNCVITFDIEPSANCQEYGLRLRSDESGDNGYLLSFKPQDKKVTLAHDASLDNVAGLNRKISVTIVMKDDIIDVDIDHRRCLVNRLPDQNGSYLWMYAKGGSVSISNIQVR